MILTSKPLHYTKRKTTWTIASKMSSFSVRTRKPLWYGVSATYLKSIELQMTLSWWQHPTTVSVYIITFKCFLSWCDWNVRMHWYESNAHVCQCIISVWKAFVDDSSYSMDLNIQNIPVKHENQCGGLHWRYLKRIDICEWVSKHWQSTTQSYDRDIIRKRMHEHVCNMCVQLYCVYRCRRIYVCMYGYASKSNNR